MTFEKAKELGVACGLSEPCEWVNNVIVHATQLFPWAKVDAELRELIEDAKAHGVKFCECGHADVCESEACYMCKQVRKVLEHSK